MLQKSESKRQKIGIQTCRENWDFCLFSNGSIKKRKVIQPLSDKMQSSPILKKNEEGSKVIIDLSHSYQLHPRYQITKATNISSRPMMRMSAQWGVTHALSSSKKSSQ